MGLEQTPSDPCLYINQGEMLVAVYVDDILIACKSTKKMEEVKKELWEIIGVKQPDYN